MVYFPTSVLTLKFRRRVKPSSRSNHGGEHKKLNENFEVIVALTVL